MHSTTSSPVRAAVIAGLIVALSFASGCSSSDATKCGDGTIKKDGTCIVDGAAGDGAAGDGASATTAGLRKAQVKTISVGQLQASATVGKGLHVGYPLKISASIDVTAEPFGDYALNKPAAKTGPVAALAAQILLLRLLV